MRTNLILLSFFLTLNIFFPKNQYLHFLSELKLIKQNIVLLLSSYSYTFFDTKFLLLLIVYYYLWCFFLCALTLTRTRLTFIEFILPNIYFSILFFSYKLKYFSISINCIVVVKVNVMMFYYILTDVNFNIIFIIMKQTFVLSINEEENKVFIFINFVVAKFNVLLCFTLL